MKFACKMPKKTARKNAGAAFIRRGQDCGGFTLIELLIYMTLIGFIIVVAGRVFSDSTSMRVRSQSMLASAEEAGRVSALLKEDISQMGAKSWEKTNVFSFASGVYKSDNDLSSYELFKVATPDSLDSLRFLKLHYTLTGVCGPIVEITWKVDGNVLKRKCRTVSTPSGCNGTFNAATDCPGEVEMAKDVTKFKLLPSKPGIPCPNPEIPCSNPETLFPTSTSSNFALKSGTATATDASKVTIGSFTKANVVQYCLALSNNCQELDFKVDEEYAIEFDLKNEVNNSDQCVTGNSCSLEDKYNPMTMFQAGRDHLSVGLRNSSGAYISNVPDFMFYPPQNENATVKRHFSFSVPSNAAGVNASTKILKARVGITASFYSDEAHKGHLDFSNFKVYRKSEKVYHFDQKDLGYNPGSASTPNNRASVKAFELTLGITKRGETNRVVTVIPVPNNGVAGGGNI
jgi:Tfp pilus assembly protein PilW